MREFFRGWRRKVGCVTLVMACAITLLWLRSRFQSEQICFRPSDTIEIQIELVDATADCACRWATRETFSEFNVIDWQSGPRRHSHQYRGTVPQIRLMEFSYVRPDCPSPRGNSIILHAPYPIPATILTLLSAYLLLWKPRKRKAESDA